MYFTDLFTFPGCLGSPGDVCIQQSAASSNGAPAVLRTSPIPGPSRTPDVEPGMDPVAVL